MAKSKKKMVISKKKPTKKKKASAKKNPLAKMLPWLESMVARCPTCDTPYEEGRTGKAQPLCICHLICDDCGGRIVHHAFGEDPKFPNVAGDWCTRCGPMGSRQDG